LRKQGPSGRLEICLGLSRATRELAIAGIKQAHPDRLLSATSYAKSLPNVFYGAEVARRVFAGTPGMSDALEDVVDIALRVARRWRRLVRPTLSAEVWPARSTGTAATNDIDFVIDMAVGKVRELSELLGTDFEVDSHSRRTIPQ